MEAAELRSALTRYVGTTQYFPHWTRFLLYTDGVKFLAETARAYWLIDAIALFQPRAMKDGALREFQLWELFVRNSRGMLVCSRDTEDQAFRYPVAYTDFPLDYVRLYVEGGVLLLPSEH